MWARRSFNYLLPRAPLLIVSLVFALLAVLIPDQIKNIISDEWGEGSFLSRIGFFLPVILAAAANIVLLSGVTVIRPLPDLTLATLPLAALSVMMLRASPSTLYLSIVTLLLAIALNWWTLRRVTDSPKRYRAVAIAVLGIVVWISASAVLIFYPIKLPTALGLTVVTIGVSLIGLAAATVLVWPRVAIAYLLVCLITALFGPPQRAIPLVPASDNQAPPLEEGLHEWLNTRADLEAYRQAKRPYPIIISSAEGGGIYAAAHSYMVLSVLQEICPGFSHHLFASVGVSGGSIGNLIFRSNLKDEAPSGLIACRKPSKQIDLSPVASDFLSPTLANLLVGQVADFLVPWVQIMPDGGRVLADTIAADLPNSDKLTQPLGVSWSPRSSLPAEIFVTTDVNRGNRFIMSAIGGDIAHNAETFPLGSNLSENDIPSNQAAVASARFPWLTSTARLLAHEGDYRVLADGGYFENSGAETVIDLIEEIQNFAKPCTAADRGQSPVQEQCTCPIIVETAFVKDLSWTGCEKHIYFAYLPIIGQENGIPGYTYETTLNPHQNYLSDPLTTMLWTRTTRGQLALTRARRVLIKDDPDMVQGTNVHGGYFPHSMPIEELNLPLGWKLSSIALTRMRDLVAPTEKCGFLPGGEFFEDSMYVADDDKWWNKLMAEQAASSAQVDSDEPEAPAGQLMPPSPPPTGSGEQNEAGQANKGDSESSVESETGLVDTAVEGNACNMLLLAWLFNPAGTKDYYGIPAWGHP
ncbi:MFS transporter [Rhizobium leguminosarum]|uniref:MFS transporter n=1 Tax=Rhizobium leguminosarum TaxID=384 RepID=UPI00144235D3|nr:MFS transporter [Rhizobium leguminosarum]MBY5818136.1 MFS transporter [Rhizobium leguminosarum]NKK96974.1 hypothetical protein [Rhizobium leguminosarum bv. viciae]NKL79511.1 hypothetical protein [Rhizobium leguminosarum bv. viciae]